MEADNPTRRRLLKAIGASLLAPLGAAVTPMARAAGAGTRVYHDPACLLHLAGSSHPERPARLEAALRALSAERLRGRVEAIDG